MRLTFHLKVNEWHRIQNTVPLIKTDANNNIIIRCLDRILFKVNWVCVCVNTHTYTRTYNIIQSLPHKNNISNVICAVVRVFVFINCNVCTDCKCVQTA